jgi:anti-sigma factor RsiW
MGMTTFPRSAPCERACSWAAVASDGELCELEQRLLDAHLARCGACSRFAVQVAAVAAELRAAAFQPLSRPVSVPGWRRRTVAARLRTIGAAAAVAVTALGVASRAPLSAGEQSFQLPAVADSGSDRAEQQALRDLRRDVIVAGIEARSRRSGSFGDQPA